ELFPRHIEDKTDLLGDAGLGLKERIAGGFHEALIRAGVDRITGERLRTAEIGQAADESFAHAAVELRQRRGAKRLVVGGAQQETADRPVTEPHGGLEAA